MHHQTQALTITDRQALNEKIILCLRRNLKPDPTLVFNSFTGKGGLHGLNFDDYANYTKFSQAKKEIELGQFFTPDHLAKAMTEILQIRPDELVLDPSCGKGSLFNHIEKPERCFGLDIDEDAIDVAKYCFPTAQIEYGDFTTRALNRHFHAVVANPPFNLRVKLGSREMYSQDAFLEQCVDWLYSGGLVAMITPESWLEDAMLHAKSRSLISKHFKVIAECPLPDAFNIAISTKLVILQKAWDRKFDFAEWVGGEEYAPAYCKFNIDYLKKLVRAAREEARANPEVLAKMSSERSIEGFQDAECKKLIFDIERNPKLKNLAAVANKLVFDLKHQIKPSHVSQEEWDKRRLTWSMVRGLLKDILTHQHTPEEDKIVKVRDDYGYHYKGYSLDSRRKAREQGRTPSYRLYLHSDKSDPLFRKRFRKWDWHSSELRPKGKYKDIIQQIPFKKWDVLSQSVMTAYMTEMQAEDLSCFWDLDYGYIAWAPGTGKTPTAYIWANHKATPYTLVISTANSIRGTWKKFLTINEQPFTIIDSLNNITDAREGYLLLTYQQAVKLKYHLKKFIKMNRHRMTVIIDEADALCNENNLQTNAVQALVRRIKYKFLTTGTITRNHAGELFPQLETLYNNSPVMTCYAYSWTNPNTGDPERNPIYNEPFPARGMKYFKGTFSPHKPSVFGIEKMTQDITNLDALTPLLNRMRISRTFKEMAGDKYTIHLHTCKLRPEELDVQNKIMTEFHEMKHYFKSTGDARKESGLRAVRQLKLLIESSSFGHLFREYLGTGYSTKMLKIKSMIQGLDGPIAIGLSRATVFGRDYPTYWEKFLSDLGRPLFPIFSENTVEERQFIADRCQRSPNGILISTQMALQESLNIPEIRHVLIPEFRWNNSRHEQYFGRFVRFDSISHTDIHFIVADRTVDVNLWNLIVNKERLNAVVREGEIPSDSELCRELGIDEELLEVAMEKVFDDDGNSFISWRQNISAY